jgi:hypothetical protein
LYGGEEQVCLYPLFYVQQLPVKALGELLCRWRNLPFLLLNKITKVEKQLDCG